MDNLRGATLMVLAMLGFAVEDMLIKQMAGSMPVGQVIFVLGLVGALIFGGLAKAYGDKLFSTDTRTPALLFRNVAEVFGTFGFVCAIALTPISTASAILQATPLVVTMGAALFLQESVGWRRWVAIAVGLFGVLLIIRPGAQSFDAKSLFAVMAVIGLAARDLATRRIDARTSSRVITFYAFAVSLVTGLLLLALGITGDQLVVPSTTDSIRLVLAVIVGITAYYLIVLATRIGEMSVIAPFRYSRLVFALVIGVVAFQERPDALTLIGAAIIVVSGIYTLWREQRLRRASKRYNPTL